MLSGLQKRNALTSGEHKGLLIAAATAVAVAVAAIIVVYVVDSTLI